MLIKIYKIGIKTMLASKSISLFLGLLILSGCGASSGPIKIYDDNAVKDASKISILYMPPEVELVEANGKEYETPFIEKGYNEVHILPGKHILAFKYVSYWGEITTGNMVVSSPVFFNLHVKGNENLYIKYKKPNDEWEAQNIASRFEPWIESGKGKKLKVSGSQFVSTSLSSSKGATGLKRELILKKPLNELKFWWEKATSNEKEEFKKWLVE